MKVSWRALVLLLCLSVGTACEAPRTQRVCGILDRGPSWRGQMTYLRLIEPDSGAQHTLVRTEEALFNGGLSPDGTKVLYTWRDTTRWGDTWIMPLDGSEPRPLAGSAAPVPSRGEGWSFDGRKAAFSVSVEGGAWFCSREYYVVDAASGSVSKLPVSGWAAAWSPRDQRIAILCGYGEDAGVWVIDTDTGESKRVLQTGAGEPELAWSPDAQEIALVGGMIGSAQEYLFVVDVESVTGRMVEETDADRGLRALSWSPEGDRIAFLVDEPRGLVGVTNALIVLDLRTAEETRLVEVEGEMWGPLIWSPDGSHIAFDGPSGDRSYGCISTVDVATGQVTQLADEPEPHEILA